MLFRQSHAILIVFMPDTTSLEALQGELGQGTTTVPSFDVSALMPLMITSIAITIILTILFLIYVSFNTIRRYKVEKATLEMQKDVRRMRELMEEGITPPAPRKQLDLIAALDTAQQEQIGSKIT